jgi:hypothetical protein
MRLVPLVKGTNQGQKYLPLSIAKSKGPTSIPIPLSLKLRGIGIVQTNRHKLFKRYYIFIILL